MAAIAVASLIKTYGKPSVQALKGISFEVQSGELFGLIGPDGAGKTSLFRILTSLLLPDGGTAHVNGWDVVKDYREIRSRVGYMPGRFSLYPDLTVEENLRFFATVFGTSIAQNYHLIKDIYEQIAPFKDRRSGKLSGGMKQKLALCCALIHKPEVLFLDEPTTGVDPVSRREFWEMLKRLRGQDITILVSTPYMDEATLCDRIALIQEGQILSIDTPEGIVNAYPHPLYAIKADHMFQLKKDLNTYVYTNHCYTFGAYLHASFKPHAGDCRMDVLSYLSHAGHTGLECTLITPTIEDCFINRLYQAPV